MMNLLFILQDEANGAAQAATQGAGELKMPLMELLIKGGILMIPIILLSFVAVYILNVSLLFSVPPSWT